MKRTDYEIKLAPGEVLVDVAEKRMFAGRVVVVLIASPGDMKTEADGCRCFSEQADAITEYAKAMQKSAARGGK